MYCKCGNLVSIEDEEEKYCDVCLNMSEHLYDEEEPLEETIYTDAEISLSDIDDTHSFFDAEITYD